MSGTTRLIMFSKHSMPWKGIGVLLFAILSAKWTWVFLAPPPLVALPPKPDIVSSNSATLFGVATTAAPTNALANVQLKGLFSGEKGFAIFKIDGNRQLGVALGEEISKGNKLVEIGTDYVVIENNRMQVRIILENNKVVTPAQSAEVKSPITATPQAAQAIAEWNHAQQQIQNTKNIIP